MLCKTKNWVADYYIDYSLSFCNAQTQKYVLLLRVWLCSIEAWEMGGERFTQIQDNLLLHLYAELQTNTDGESGGARMCWIDSR